jgi:hypothetical protein
MPFSQNKMKVYSKLKYWASKLNVLKGKEFNPEVMERRRIEAEKDEIETTIIIARERLQQAKEEWKEVVQTKKEI